MIKIVKKEIGIDESLISRLNVICDFCNTTFSIENGVLGILNTLIWLMLSHIELLLIINSI